MTELIELWRKTLTGDSPPEQQFAVWLATYDPDVVRRGILKTASKDLSIGQTMTLDHKIRFASKVMSTRVQDLKSLDGCKRKPEVGAL
jgi:hypothetical protein